MSTKPTIKRALISVSDKIGLVEIARQLSEFNIEIIATGGTAKALSNAGIAVTEVSEFTGCAEILGGRVKSLHPKIFGGLLGKHDNDQQEMQQHDIAPIDLVIVNLYPFQHIVKKPNATHDEIIEHIDIGGPSLLRAAAKNYKYVTVMVDTADYLPVLAEIKSQGYTHLATRQRLARKAFAHTANYDKTIGDYFKHLDKPKIEKVVHREFPAIFTPTFHKVTDLRYGENPHQHAAFYSQTVTQPGTLAAADQLQGKPLSYNNLLDGDTAFECVRALGDKKPACVIVKHATICGAACADSLVGAYQSAYTTDPVSAFGGIIALNKPLDKATAKAIVQQQFAEVLITPQVHVDALEICATKPNLRILTCGSRHNHFTALNLRSISGGLLIQEMDNKELNPQALTAVTDRQPNEEELRDLLFAWRVVKYVKSNAIVYARNTTTIAIGSGQTSRILSAKLALQQAQETKLPIQGAVMASDAFFPFADSIELAASAGITAIIQPGGSLRDKAVIEAANRARIAMVFTQIRHFRH